MHLLAKPFYFCLFEYIAMPSCAPCLSVKPLLFWNLPPRRPLRHAEHQERLVVHPRIEQSPPPPFQRRTPRRHPGEGEVHVLQSTRASCVLPGSPKVNLSVPPPPSFCECRSTIALSRGRAIVLAPPTTAARKCQSLPPRCANPSSSSPSTKFPRISKTYVHMQ